MITIIYNCLVYSIYFVYYLGDLSEMVMEGKTYSMMEVMTYSMMEVINHDLNIMYIDKPCVVGEKFGDETLLMMHLRLSWLLFN